MSSLDHGTKRSKKALAGSIVIVVLLICGMAVIQRKPKSVSEQKILHEQAENMAVNNHKDTATAESVKVSDTGEHEEKERKEESLSSKTEEDYYSMAVSLTAEEVEGFAKEIKNDILTCNWEAFAEKISYPIAVGGVTVNDREDFFKLDLDEKLKQEFVEAIREETCQKMFCNWQGVKMGAAGQIWFANVDNGEGASELMIIGINDML